MITLRKSADRGHANHGWLDSYHTFSFASYYDPKFMNFRSLRVINEDRISPGAGFPTHSHQDMEIITYVWEGALEHKDSLGNGEIIHPGEVQRMTAGTGIQHSEFNPSKTEGVHLFQMWILPEKKGLTPSYEQRKFQVKNTPNQWHLLVSKDGRDGALKIHQDVDLYGAFLRDNCQLSHSFGPNRHGWLQLAQGKITANGVSLDAGDAVAISDEEILTITSHESSQFLLFDLA
jgi:redox-sensitive bicupin YhaK (pirin superfamily)